jgi:molybdopterin-guanine dinucleotide biosynthesis protein A
MPRYQPAPQPFLRCCLLSGGASLRMGQDKALLPHAEGGTWLERTLRLLAELKAPITLLSRWPQHLTLAKALALPQLETIQEPPPWEGPLLAVHRLVERYPSERLLITPVDMPELNAAALHGLLSAAAAAPQTIQLAQGGVQLQPLLAVLPADATIRHHLAMAVAKGERRLQSWLMEQRWQAVPLEPQAMRNCNRPEELQLRALPQGDQPQH